MKGIRVSNEQTMDSEHGSHEGKAPRTLFVEGATQAPVIDANLGTVFILDK
jgi:hypothetical protein